MPPLTDGEGAPEDAPNYFDARELGSATIAAFAACNDTIARAYPDAAEATQTAYCGCYADAARSNVRARRAVNPTEAQVGRCIDVTRTRARSPFARQFATSTAAIADTLQACLAATLEGVSTSYRGFTCSCATNAWIVDRLQASKLDDDLARCAAAGRYREATGQNPTVRQFGAIRIARSLDRTGSGAQQDRASPGAFIPYPGNGGGATPCSDGTYSHSTGRGTCSHHGGVSGGRHRRR
ncbi:MAG TPA: hypothetical protein VGD37_12610 [Kofleriaceae bacterium]